MIRRRYPALSQALLCGATYVSPMGANGVGEIGIVSTAAAIANAVHHATGVRVRDLPIALHKLLRAPSTT